MQISEPDGFGNVIFYDNFNRFFFQVADYICDLCKQVI